MRSFESYVSHQIFVDQDAPGHIIAFAKWRSRADADAVREKYKDSETIRRLTPRDRWVTREDQASYEFLPKYTLRRKGGSMPLVTVTIREGKSGEFKSAVLGAVHNALIASGVPEKDRFQRVLELSSDDFRFDPEYPDLTARRTDDFVLIEILLSVGRSVKVKKKIVADILAGLSKGLGLNAENVMVCFKETLWENWSFGGGRFFYT
jgi:phenylpyruvate tautomerase PptA (4-oxalocrotonate tautomerase family)